MTWELEPFKGEGRADGKDGSSECRQRSNFDTHDEGTLEINVLQKHPVPIE